MKPFLRRIHDDNRLMLTFYLTITGFVFLVTFIIVSVLNDNLPTARMLSVGTAIGLINFFLFNTRYRHWTTYNVSLVVSLLALHLLIFGGLDNTGYLWTYAAVLLGIAVLSFKQGAAFGLFYVTCSAVIMYNSTDYDWIVDYESTVASRYMMSIIAVCITASVLVKIQELTNQKLNKKNVTDELTGLYNRSVVNEKNFAAALMKPGASNYLMLIDVDHFKYINDNFGHAIGDAVLQRLAVVLNENTRSSDMVVRWGGEEFLVLLKDCNEAAALQKSEELRSIIESDQELYDAISKPVTISIGLSFSEPLKSLDEGLRVADLNLYEAKNSGRNQVVFKKQL